MHQGDGCACLVVQVEIQSADSVLLKLEESNKQ